MSNFTNMWSAIGKDKYVHYTVCLLITLFLYAIGSACGMGSVAIAPAFVIALLVGFLKEKHDSKNGGRFDHYDIVADFLGSFTAVVIAALLLI